MKCYYVKKPLGLWTVKTSNLNNTPWAWTLGIFHYVLIL